MVFFRLTLVMAVIALVWLTYFRYSGAWAFFVWAVAAVITLAASNSEKGEHMGVRMGISGEKGSWGSAAAACAPALVVLVLGTTSSLTAYYMLMAALFASPSLRGVLRVDCYRRFVGRSVEQEVADFAAKRKAVVRDLYVFGGATAVALLVAFSYVAPEAGWQGVMVLCLAYLLLQQVYVARADFRLAEPETQKQIAQAWKGGIALCGLSLGASAYIAFQNNVDPLPLWVALGFTIICAVAPIARTALVVVERDKKINEVWAQECEESDTERELKQLAERMGMEEVITEVK